METANLTEKSGLVDAIRYFSDPMICIEAVAAARWKNGPECPRCTCTKVSFLKTRKLWTCLGCRKQFSVKVGTIFEDSAVGLDKWLTAMWLVGNCKNGISSYEIARDVKVTQRTAWFMLHRIRYAMHTGSVNKMTGTVEADETFIGGAARFMHKHKRDKIRGRGPEGKAIVFGLLERETGKVRTHHVPTRRKSDLQAIIHDNVAPGAELNTDALLSYEGLGSEYAHRVVDHAETYVNGTVHTNRLENFWSLLKRSIKGTYVSVEPFHLFRYLDEQAFRYNERHDTDAGRFAKVLQSVSAKRLTYDQVRG